MSNERIVAAMVVRKFARNSLAALRDMTLIDSGRKLLVYRSRAVLELPGRMEGISPPLPIVVPGTITASLVLSPLQSGMGIQKIFYFNAYP